MFLVIVLGPGVLNWGMPITLDLLFYEDGSCIVLVNRLLELYASYLDLLFPEAPTIGC